MDIKKYKSILTQISKIIQKITQFCVRILFVILVVALVASTLRGEEGNPSPSVIADVLLSESKPFELSPERGRYAIVQALAEYKSLSFPKEIAEYVTPDLGYKDGKFVSLFAPGVSFIAYPFYLLGRSFGLAQVAAFSVSGIFAIFNMFLITWIIKKLTNNKYAGLVGALTFMFGTTSWAYSATLYQHHFTTFFLLSSIYLLLGNTRFFTSFMVGIFLGLSFFIEYPNVIFFIPILILLVSRHITVEIVPSRCILKFKYILILGSLGLVLSLVPTFLYNQQAYGDPFQLAGTVKSVKNLIVDWDTGEVLLDKSVGKKTAFGFFAPERLPSSMDVLLTSKDRGLIFFSPVILIGILGIYPLYKKRKDIAYLLLGGIGIILLLYGMWGDPWGGWAFGPRYLIPAMSQMAILLGVAINKYGRKWWFAISFLPLLIYSVVINLAGALTTNQLPPSVEVDYAKYPDYIFLHNIELVKQGTSGSFIYNTFLIENMTLINYAGIIFVIVIILILINYILAFRKSGEVKS